MRANASDEQVKLHFWSWGSGPKLKPAPVFIVGFCRMKIRACERRKIRGRTELKPSTCAKRQEEETHPGCLVADFARSAKKKQKNKKQRKHLWCALRCRPAGATAHPHVDAAAELGCGQRRRIAGGCGQNKRRA